MTINTDMTVGQLAAEVAGAPRLFEKLGIDYCCGGGRRLSDACVASGLTSEKVAALLVEANNSGDKAEQSDWTVRPLSDLMDHIVRTHHQFTRDETVRLSALLEKVCRVHGKNHTEIRTIQVVFEGLREELTSHMLREEQVLFPYIGRLETAVKMGEAVPTPFFVTVRNPIRMMVQEHDGAGEALRKMREVSSGYRVPADACISFRTLYEALEGLEMDLHRHIHLENNILFPRATQLEGSA
jgi:regulator of cell morphogenesis and NO signaling